MATETTPSTPSSCVHRERLWPGPLGWSFVLGFAAFALVAVLPVHTVAAFVASGAAAALGVVVAVRTSTLVTVTDTTGGGELRAGRAHIPLTALGPARTLDRDGVRAALGPGSDARAFACLRSWIPGAVEVDVVDPDDPTPTWLISTRRPSELLAALQAGQKGSQAAHSEQIG